MFHVLIACGLWGIRLIETYTKAVKTLDSMVRAATRWLVVNTRL